ncbi:hypothetical protein FSP39_019283 [Pinctada imbricata]|uniref:Uncharacterized protein n=1 Tax=Pinctada imbricata TaxID=66713 RepID=A0AA88XJR5_PINIB|nr:hypothetical protein FSP39_019283 [Pinctada imbricata]
MDKNLDDKGVRNLSSLPSITASNVSPKIRSGENNFFPPISEDKSVSKSPSYSKQFELRRMSSVNGLVRRRSSTALLSPTSPTAAKPTFRSIGGKVTTMLRAKMAFQRKNSNSSENQTGSDITVIKELPSTPRFSSTLSPEAQFALMKGYEDTVYGYLCTSYPEHKNVLRRTRTPKNSIDIKDVPREVNTPVKDGNLLRAESPFYQPTERSGQNSPTSVILPLSRSTSLSTIRPGTGQSSKLSRTQSQPVLVPYHKQLVLTHRLQSAMDILDTVRGNMGMHAISPRIQTNSQDSNPVQDYNSWIRVWNTEFQISKPKTRI